MTDQIVPAPTLAPIANPVSRYVAPRQEVAPQTNAMLELASALQQVNPNIQGFLQNRYNDLAATETAAGQLAEQQVDPRIALQRNREGWLEVINNQRARDAEEGTNIADTLVGASPHFRRGMVTARVERLGMGLSERLREAYEGGGLSGVTDPAQVQAWVMQQVQAYSEEFGLNNIDPVIVAEQFLPYSNQAIQQVQRFHQQRQAAAAQATYRADIGTNVGMLLDGAATQEVSAEDAVRGGTGVTPEVIEEYNAANGTSYSAMDYEAQEGVNEAVTGWYANRIDEAIIETGAVQQGWNPSGLRAVASDFGVTGLGEFLETRGEAPLTTNRGTTAAQSYSNHAGPAFHIQRMLDTAIANGMRPAEANNQIVEAVIASALEQRDPQLLEVLNNISTGNGALGNITSVREDVLDALDDIEDEIWEDEQRTHTRLERERDLTRRAVMNEATATLMSDPEASIEEFISVAVQQGEPLLVQQLMELQNTMLDAADTVRTDPELFLDIRMAVSGLDSEQSAQEMRDAIRFAATNRQLSRADASTLLSEIDRNRSFGDFLDDSYVRGNLSDLETAVRSRFSTRDAFGNNYGGHEQATTARDAAVLQFMAWLEQNPDATRTQAIVQSQNITREILNDSRFSNPELDPVTPAGSYPNQAAAEAVERDRLGGQAQGTPTPPREPEAPQGLPVPPVRVPPDTPPVVLPDPNGPLTVRPGDETLPQQLVNYIMGQAITDIINEGVSFETVPMALRRDLLIRATQNDLSGIRALAQAAGMTDAEFLRELQMVE